MPELVRSGESAVECCAWSRRFYSQTKNLSGAVQRVCTTWIPFGCLSSSLTSRTLLGTTRMAASFPFWRSSRSHLMDARPECRENRRWRLFWSYLPDWCLSIFLWVSALSLYFAKNSRHNTALEQGIFYLLDKVSDPVSKGSSQIASH